MQQVRQHLDTLLHDRMRLPSADITHKPYAAGILLIRGIVKPLRFGVC